MRFLAGNKFMTRDECSQRHQTESQANDELSRKITELQQQQTTSQQKTENKLNIMFRMVRGLVVYSEMAAETKEKILNERGRPDD